VSEKSKMEAELRFESRNVTRRMEQIFFETRE
jgi:hypothetical protein